MKRIVFALFGLYLAASTLPAATFTVDSTGDEPDMNTADNVCETAVATCTLRAAILQANATAGADTIAFDIPGAGVHTIAPATVFPDFTEGLTIDGYTQPGSSPNTDPVATNAVILIEIDGTATTGIGLRVFSAGPTLIRGLAVNRFGTGVLLSGAGSHEVRGCFIGTDPSGTVALGNGSEGITFGNGGDFTIGGAAPADRNLVAGNTAGIDGGGFISGSFHVIGNLVGTDATGQFALPNDTGMWVSSGSASTIIGNVISGNATIGLVLNFAAGVTVRGNRIGTTADGSGPLANGNDGIRSFGNNNVIGGIGPGEANEIAYNGFRGFIDGVGGSQGTGNVIRGNSIHDNGLIGIDLNANGVSPNDPGDGDTGSNNLQNFPILQTVEHLGPQGNGSTRIVGKLDSAASTTYDLDFYSNSICSNFPREFVEGETWLGTTQVTTDGTGHAAIDVTLPVATEVGARITATATDPAGNTSEFSQRIIFSIFPVSGPAQGGVPVTIKGTDFAVPTGVQFSGVEPAGITVVDSTTIATTTPALGPGLSHDVVALTPDGTSGTLIKGWVTDFLDVPQAHIFHDFVVTLISNGITVGVGGGLYGVTQDTLRQQMAVFLLKAKRGLCFVPPPCTVQTFDDVPCSLSFAPWINELVAQGITGGCAGGGNNYCPASPVLRQQMAVLLLRTLGGAGYAPPACTVETFTDVSCASTFGPWIYDLVGRGITAGCGGGLYCPTLSANRGQMATFIVKTFGLQ
jgi:CSLREA domain-containing protein